MKKRIVSLCLLAALALTMLAGCAGKQENSGDADVHVDLTEFYTTVSENYELPATMELSGDMLTAAYPGLEDLTLNQQVLYTAMMSSVAFELSLVEAASAEDAATVADIFQARIDAQVDGGAFYPETIENWQNNSQIVTCGNYVMLVVHESHADIAADFEALF